MLENELPAALLLKAPRSVLLLTEQPRLLNRIRHHLLLLEPLLDVVAIQLEVALLAEAEKDLRTEAAAYDICDCKNDQKVGSLLQPVGHSRFFFSHHHPRVASGTRTI